MGNIFQYDDGEGQQTQGPPRTAGAPARPPSPKGTVLQISASLLLDKKSAGGERPVLKAHIYDEAQ